MGPEELWTTSRQTALHCSVYEGPGEGGPSVVVLHGLVTGVDVLRSAMPGLDPFARLAEEGLNVLALDWPGHGRSGGRRGRLTYRLAMDAAATAVEVAGERWGGPVGIFGTALGGVLGFYAALEGDDVGAVACHNVLDLRDVQSVVQRRRQGVLMPVAGFARRRLPAARHERVPVPAAAVVAKADLAADPDVARVLLRHPEAVRRYDLESLASILLTPEDKPDIGAQRTPTFVAVGSEDRLLPETMARGFVSRLTCSTELWTLPGGGHQLFLEHSSALVPAVGDFLRRHLAAA